LGLTGGKGTVAAGNTDGNVWLHTSPGAYAAWQSGEMIFAIGNAVTEPLAVDATGAFLWAYGNNLKTNAPLYVGDSTTLPTTGDLGMPSNFTMVVKSTTGEATFLAVDAANCLQVGSNDTDLADTYFNIPTAKSFFWTVAGTTKLTLTATALTVANTLAVQAGLTQKPTVVTHAMSPYTVLASDSIINCDVTTAPAGAIIITWPAVATMVNRRVTVLDWNAGAAGANISIAITDSTINGGAGPVVINTNGGGCELFCDGVKTRSLQATV